MPSIHHRPLSFNHRLFYAVPYPLLAAASQCPQTTSVVLLFSHPMFSPLLLEAGLDARRPCLERSLSWPGSRGELGSHLRRLSDLCDRTYDEGSQFRTVKDHDQDSIATTWPVRGASCVARSSNILYGSSCRIGHLSQRYGGITR